MTRFSPRPIRFGRRPGADQDDEADDLPTPQRVRLQARRQAGIAEAKQVLEYLPEAGEGLFALTTSRMDLCDILNTILERLGRCDRMHVASLGFGERNLKMMLGWLDSGAVGELMLLSSIFWKAHNPGLWKETLTEFRQRGQKVAVAASHAKVCAMVFASGERLSVAGSANLRASGSTLEQVGIFNDSQLAEWNRRWIDALVTKHEGDADE